MSIHGPLAIGIAAAAWLAWAYWCVSYIRTANVLVRWIEDNDPGYWTRGVPVSNKDRAQYYPRRNARRLEWLVLFGSSGNLPKNEGFQDHLGDARWAAGFTLFFWTIAIAATGMLSLP